MKALLIVTSIILVFSAACTPDRTAAAREKESEETATDWRLERDAYISRMEHQLDDLDHKIDAVSDKASAHSKEALKVLKERIRKLKADMIEAKGSAEGNWEVAKQRMEHTWDTIRGDYDRTEHGM